MFERLHNHIQDTISIMDGYTIGRLIHDKGKVFLALEICEVILLSDKFLIEVRNGDEYMPVTFNQVLNAKNEVGWPLMAGLDARIKLKNVA